MVIKSCLLCISINWYEWVVLHQAMDIAPVHTILSEIMVSGIAERYVLTDCDSIEVLSLKENVVAVYTDCVTLVVRSHITTHNTFITSVCVRDIELRTVSTTSQCYRVVLLSCVLIVEYIPPVSTFPTVSNAVEDVLWNIVSEVKRLTACVDGVLVHDSHVLLSVEELWALVNI